MRDVFINDALFHVVMPEAIVVYFLFIFCAEVLDLMHKHSY